MKHNIKTNLKLAGVCATAMMTLSGCFRHENVIENIESNKILVRDISDGKQRIVEFQVDERGGHFWKRALRNSLVGDTVFLKCMSGEYKEGKCFTAGRGAGVNVDVKFDYGLLAAREDKSKFDSLKCAFARNSQEKQR